MTKITDAAAAAFPDGPSSNPTQPPKSLIRSTFKAVSDDVEEIRALAQLGVQPPRQSVRLLVTTNVAIASALENGDTLDGETLVTGDRVALAGQSTASQNGVYVVVASGAAARSTDMDTADELLGSVFSVDAGTHAGETWAVQNTGEITVGTTAIVLSRTQASSPFNDELLDARGTAATVGDRLAADEEVVARVERYAEVDRRKVGGFLDKKFGSVDRFTGRAVAGIDKNTGQFHAAARAVPKLAVFIEDGDLYAAHSAFPTIVRRLTWSGDVVWCDADDVYVHFTRKLANGHVLRDAQFVPLLGGIGRAFQTTLGSGVSDLVLVLVIGQSVSAGGVQTTIVTDTPEDATRLVMFRGGARPMDGVLHELTPEAVLNYDPSIGVNENQLHLPARAMDRLVGLRERFIGTTWGETPCSGIGRQMLDRLPSSTGILVSAHGVGSTALATYQRGTPMYDNMLRAAEVAKYYATALGIGFRVAAVFAVNGEENQTTTPVATWRDANITFQAHLDEDLKAISGQAQTVPLVLSQISSWTKVGSGSTTSNIAKGQFEAARTDNTKIMISGPRYTETHTSPDGVHLPPKSSKIVGERAGRLIASIIDGAPAVDLYPLSAVASGTTLVTTWSRGDLAARTDLVSDPGAWGCRLTVTTGTLPTLSSPTITGDDEITFTMSSSLNVGTQAPRFHVADLGTVGDQPGPTSGPRSPICSETADTDYDGGELHFFATSCDIAVS